MKKRPYSKKERALIIEYVNQNPSNRRKAFQLVAPLIGRNWEAVSTAYYQMLRKNYPGIKKSGVIGVRHEKPNGIKNTPRKNVPIVIDLDEKVLRVNGNTYTSGEFRVENGRVLRTVREVIL